MWIGGDTLERASTIVWSYNMIVWSKHTDATDGAKPEDGGPLSLRMMPGIPEAGWGKATS